MKCTLSMRRQDTPDEEVEVLTSKKKSGKVTLAWLLEQMDKLYFRYVEGPCGQDHYPAVVVHVSETGRKTRIFNRRAGSNAAGFPDLWVEKK